MLRIAARGARYEIQERDWCAKKIRRGKRSGCSQRCAHLDIKSHSSPEELRALSKKPSAAARILIQVRWIFLNDLEKHDFAIRHSIPTLPRAVLASSVRYQIYDHLKHRGKKKGRLRGPISYFTRSTIIRRQLLRRTPSLHRATFPDRNRSTRLPSCDACCDKPSRCRPGSSGRR
jgi:hypothetical protein